MTIKNIRNFAIISLFTLIFTITFLAKPANADIVTGYYDSTFSQYIDGNFASFDEEVLSLSEYKTAYYYDLSDEIKRAYYDYLSDRSYQTYTYSFADINGDGTLDLIMYNKGYASFVSYDESKKYAVEIGYRNNVYTDDFTYTYTYSANPDGPGIFRWVQVNDADSDYTYERVEFIDSTNYDNWREDSSKSFLRSGTFSYRIPYKLVTYTLDANMTECPFRFDNAAPTTVPGTYPTDNPNDNPTTNPTVTPTKSPSGGGSLIIMPSFDPPVTTIPPVSVVTTPAPTKKPVNNSDTKNSNTKSDYKSDSSKIIKSTGKYTIRRVDRSIRSADGRVIGALFYDKVVLKGSTKKIKKINKLIEKDCSAFFKEFENRFAEYVKEMVDWYGVDDVAEGGLECSIKSTVKTCNKSLLSIHQKYFWFAGGVSEHSEYGRTYSLKKGKLLRYRDVMKGTKANIKNVTKYFLRKKAEHIADAFSINTKKDFYVKNNKVHICYNTYTNGGFDVYNGLLGKRSITASKKMIKAAKKPWTYGLKKNKFYVIYSSSGTTGATIKGNTFTFAAEVGIPYSSQSIPYKNYSFKIAPNAKFYATDGYHTDYFTKATFAARFITANDASGVHFKLNSKGLIIDMHYSP